MLIFSGLKTSAGTEVLESCVVGKTFCATRIAPTAFVTPSSMDFHT